MNFYELTSARYSVRKYSERKVEDEKLMRILDSARQAPTACNFHPEHIFAVTSDEGMRALTSVRTVFGAPMAIVVACDKSREWKNKRMNGRGVGETDCAIVTTYLMLAATEEGLGTCYMASFDGAAITSALGIDPSLEIYAVLAVGYASEDSEPHELHYARPALENIVSII